MIPVISFIGYHNSGKTTFATQLVKILKERGYRVGILKSTKHEGVIKDTEGKDTFRYREAGTPAVGIVTPKELVLFKDVGKVELPHLAFLLFSDCDIVICEGFKSSDVPKFEVYRKELPEPPLFKKVSNVVGVISDTEIEGVRNFPIEEPEKVADFIEEEFLKRKRDVELFVDGKKIPLKPFVMSALKGVVLGFVKSLKGIEENSSNLEIRIRF
ncbi:molybdopterin-guanine dinucleotide biosynthesis protein B [Phorcysia thermohydrogeniphila]|uniref:Molybdopterin-guanine dinucleotide biosynthesis protein B n=1 Tax=Phorcysia thermohydrogeniphila TaxID=936138 RepID=A0A4R1GGQ9_9BACT|nr:molybdopterin-guanine dinucleotide biosynthesis protein B [Phorcysia thermohydrogeniphila]TCK03342.1 molybdopterin-guanine dinucleotide biosynthesis protein B [Phorcysia thermohydrogeniphila]